MLRDVTLPGAVTGDSDPVKVAISLMLQLAAVLATIYVIIGAIRFTISSGDPQQVASGRRTIIFAATGLVISLLGMTIASFVQSEARTVDASNPLFGANGIFTVVIDNLSTAVGIAAVIMVIVGSIRYITSAGNQQSAQTARNTIIYALIGVVVAIVAQLFVEFVLGRI